MDTESLFHQYICKNKRKIKKLTRQKYVRWRRDFLSGEEKGDIEVVLEELYIHLKKPVYLEQS